MRGARDEGGAGGGVDLGLRLLVRLAVLAEPMLAEAAAAAEEAAALCALDVADRALPPPVQPARQEEEAVVETGLKSESPERPSGS